MSEAAQPLSRRERRELEAAARAAEGEVTQALPVAPETESTLSRRERRRMERLARPVETWTQEEELIATGQMPAMTDEVLAEQDRLAAERAEAEARAAEAFAATAPDAGVEFVEQPSPDAVGESAAVVESAWAEQAEVQPADVEQAQAEQAEVDSAYEDTVPQPDPEPLPTQPSEPLPATAPEPFTEPQPFPEPQTAPEPFTEPAPEPQPEPDMSHIPADLRHLFPPGSLQARSFQAQEPVPAPAAPAAHNDAADEIRRLTQEAMAGITKAATDAVPIVPEQPEPLDTPDDNAEPEHAPENEAPEYVAEPAVHHDPPIFEPIAGGDDVPHLPQMAESVDVEALWNAPSIDEPLRSPLAPAAFTDVEPEPVALTEAPFVADVPVPSQVDGSSQPGAPVWSALVPAQPADIPGTRPAIAPATGFAPVSTAEQAPPAPSVWDTHPLTNPGASPVRELPAEPVQRELPRPDLTALMGTQSIPSVGQAPYASTEPATSPGALPQRPGEPRAGGGARHFRWAHLAVIGAIAFVLGVVVWNVARSN